MTTHPPPTLIEAVRALEPSTRGSRLLRDWRTEDSDGKRSETGKKRSGQSGQQPQGQAQGPDPQELWEVCAVSL